MALNLYRCAPISLAPPSLLEPLEPRALLSNGSSPVIYDNGEPVSAVVTADFNDDGLIDMAIAAGPTFALLIGRADGSFRSPRVHSIVGGFELRHLTVTDFDGNRYPDLVVGGARTWTPFVFRKRTGRFEALPPYTDGDTVLVGGVSGAGSISYEITSVVAANFDGDRISELVVTLAADGGSICQLYRVDQAGRLQVFRAIAHRSDASFLKPAAADLDGDGDTDLAITSVSENGTEILIAENESFQFDGMFFNLSFDFAAVHNEGELLGPVVAADLDDDSLPELITFRHGVGTYELVVLSNAGELQFGAPEIVSQVPRPGGAAFSVPLQIVLAPGAQAGPDVLVFEQRWSPNSEQPQQHRRAVVRRFTLQPDDTFASSAEWQVRDARPFGDQLGIAIAQDWTGEGRTDIVWFKGSRVRAMVYDDQPDVTVIESARVVGNRTRTTRQTIRIEYEFSDLASSLSGDTQNWSAQYHLDLNGNGQLDDSDRHDLFGVTIQAVGWGVVSDRLLVRRGWPRGTYNLLIELVNFDTETSVVRVVDGSITVV
jgi:hypothetical protein